MKKKISVLLIIIFVIGISTGCSSSTSEAKDKVVLRFAYADNSQPVKDSMTKFGEILEEKTNGEVVVEYYPDSQLGDERELIELTQTGAIDMTKVSGSALEGFSNKYSIFGVPYLFDDEDHYFEVMEDPDIMNPIYQSTKDLGFVGITYYNSGQRSFYMKDGPIEKPDDLKGKKIRVMESETAMEMVKLLGGTPTPMGADEVYTSLQQGIIDGSENNEFVLVTAGHGEVAEYYSYDEHTRIPDIVIMNNERLNDELSEEQRKAVYEAAEESTEYEKSVFKDAIESEKEEAAEKYDDKFNEVDTDPFIKAVRPIHEEIKNDKDLGSIYRAIRNLSKEEGGGN